MIYCILLNPTIDQLLSITQFQPGGTYQIPSSGHIRTFPVGKAISVALTLRFFDVPHKIIAFIGKAEIPMYESFLEQNDLVYDLIPIDGETRRNLTIHDPATDEVTHIRFPGFVVNRRELDRLNQILQNEIEEGDMVVFSGSLPTGVPEEYFFRPSEIIRRNGGKIIIDTSGTPLINMALYNTYFIKANLSEMEMILGKELSKSKELSQAPTEEQLYKLLDKCKDLTTYKSKCNALTLGKYGSIAMDRNEVYYAVFEGESRGYNIGCGDAYLGGWLAGWYLGENMAECLKRATACGAANTFIQGPGIFTAKYYDMCFTKVKLQRLK